VQSPLQYLGDSWQYPVFPGEVPWRGGRQHFLHPRYLAPNLFIEDEEEPLNRPPLENINIIRGDDKANSPVYSTFICNTSASFCNALCCVFVATLDLLYRIWDSAVSIETKMQAEQPGFNSQKELEIFLFLLHTDQLWGPPSLLSSEYQWFFCGGKVDRA
jgi:hypothetical protein